MILCNLQNVFNGLFVLKVFGRVSPAFVVQSQEELMYSDLRATETYRPSIRLGYSWYACIFK